MGSTQVVTTDKKKQALEPIKGRPQTGVLGSYAIDIQKVFEGLRLEHPGWGAKTIYYELLTLHRPFRLTRCV
jgi:hypothetical protein